MKSAMMPGDLENICVSGDLCVFIRWPCRCGGK